MLAQEVPDCVHWNYTSAIWQQFTKEMVARFIEICGGLCSTTTYTINVVKFKPLPEIVFFYTVELSLPPFQTCSGSSHQSADLCKEILLKSFLPQGLHTTSLFPSVNVPPASSSASLSTGRVNKLRPSLLNKWAFKLQQTGLACMGDYWSPFPSTSSKKTKHNREGLRFTVPYVISVPREWPDLTPMFLRVM